MLTAEERYWWRIALELKLRKSHGDAFQELFSTVMAKAHGTDFVKVRAYGAIGDKGCDGYLKTSGQVFACYGSLGSQPTKADYLTGKMDDDFKKAATHIASLMKEWHMVHNFVDGLPVTAIEKLNELEKKNPKLKFGFFGAEKFEDIVLALPKTTIEDLLGPVPTALDGRNMQPLVLRELVVKIVAAAEETPFDTSSIQPVPSDKLEFNKLPNHWASLISGGWQNAHLVRTYFERHADALAGEKVAQVFRVRYLYLKSQNLSPGQIMTGLYEFIAGKGTVTPSVLVAAQALLAYLFEACEIFETPPQKVSV